MEIKPHFVPNQGSVNVENVQDISTKLNQKDQKKLEDKIGTEKIDYNVELSKAATDLAKARNKAFEIAKATSAIRDEKIMELKNKIETGEYKINPEDIADGILKEAIQEKLSEMED